MTTNEAMQNITKLYLDEFVEKSALIEAQAAQLIAARAQVVELQTLIAQVTKTLGGYRDSDLLSLAETVAIGYRQWCDDNEGTFEKLTAQVAELQAWKDAVPVDALKRYCWQLNGANGTGD